MRAPAYTMESSIITCNCVIILVRGKVWKFTKVPRGRDSRSMEDSHNIRVRKRRRYYEHCEENVTKSTCFRHKSKFFDHCNRRWIKASEIPISCENSSGKEEDSSTDENFVQPTAGSSLMDLLSPSEPLPSIPESPGSDGDQGAYFFIENQYFPSLYFHGNTLIQVSQTTVWLHSYVLHAHVH